MTGPRFADPRHRAGAQAVLLTVTAEAYGFAPVDALLDLGVDGAGRLFHPADGNLEPLTALEVAAGAATVLGKLVADVEAVLGVDRSATLASVGRWVVADELEEV